MTMHDLQAVFSESTVASFRFLTDKYSFVLKASQSCSFEYTKDQLSLTVSWTPYSYELNIDVRRDDTGEQFSLYEIVAALAPTEMVNIQCSGADSAKMKRGLDRLSQVFQQHLHGVLTLDEATLKKVSESVSSLRTQYTLDAQYGAIKDRANQAWERKDWEKARELYNEAKPGLSSAEERRLDFLLKKSP